MKIRAFVCMLAFLCMGLSSVRGGGFEAWCGIWPVTPDACGDDDFDDAVNLLEYAFDGNPVDGSYRGVEPELSVVNADGAEWLYLVHAERRTDADLAYTIYVNEDPVFGNWSAVPWEFVGEGDEILGMVSVTNRLEIAFASLQVMVEVEYADDLGIGAFAWSPEMSYPLGSGGGAYFLDITSGTGSGYYDEGIEVSVVADAPSAGMEFAGWGGGFNDFLNYLEYDVGDYDQLMYYWSNWNNPVLTVTMPPFDLWLEAAYQPVPSVELSSITISGPATVDGGSTNNYTCTAFYTGGSQSNVTDAVQWSASGAVGSIDAVGELIASEVEVLEEATVSASYSDGGITKSDSFDIVIKHPALELGYVNIGVGADPLILSNKTFVSDAGSASATIGSFGGLQVYDCLFTGKDGGSGLSLENIDTVSLAASNPSFTAVGGKGISLQNTSSSAASVVGGNGIEFTSPTASSLVLDNMTAMGGNGGNLFSDVFGATGNARGGSGFVAINNMRHSIQLNGGQFIGGDGGEADGLGYTLVDVGGGHGAWVEGSLGTGQLLITDGLFAGGNGGLAFDSASVSDGGAGLFLEQGAIATISGGLFTGGDSGYGATTDGGNGVEAYNASVSITGGVFSGGEAYYGEYDGAGLCLNNSSASISGGSFDLVRLAGVNNIALSGSPMIESLYQAEGSGNILLSESGEFLGGVVVEGGALSVNGATWVLSSGMNVAVYVPAQLQVSGFVALAGSRITTQSGSVLSGSSLTLNSGCDWTIDAGGNYFAGTVALATASGSLSSSLNASDVSVWGDGTTSVSGLFTSNSTLYAVVEEIPVGFDGWSAGIADPGQRGQADRPDGDGIANLMKYACGLPSGTYVSNLFDYAVVSGTPTNAAAFVVTYQKAKGVSDVTVFPEHTEALSDAGAWSSTGMTLQKTGETAEQETWEASFPFTTNGFMRLKAEMVP
ncbi:autotransporter outer membrane beta-barrel domain-containing protein [Pontiella sulfatireligans]|uniref:BIG2 domain-containing protein n=1 Tax=Pontiella sulfatireligans TaxID=2750658 RepID=A0A6C2UPX0_9BACT|nr:hypothetical protein [Pontiella sulfatireligans]VGO21321.1 hypothetical protein SCARR_03393 [Pontiella sulfatireligans]